MKTLQNSVPQPDEEQKHDHIEELQGSSQVATDIKQEKLWELHSEAPTTESSSDPVPSTENKKVTCEEIQLVQNLIERCLQLYMNEGEVVKTLLNRAKIEPNFTSLVWQKLREQNHDFFKAYYARLKLKNQIVLFNRLLEQQNQLMRMQNGMHPAAVHHPPMGYPVYQQSHFPAAGHHHSHLGISNQTVVNGIPAQGNFLSVPLKSSAENVADSFMEANPVMQNSENVASTATAMSANPDSTISTGSYPFDSTDISGVCANVIPLDLPFLSGDTGGLNGLCTLQSTSDGSGKDSLRSLTQPLQNFSLLDLTADLTNGDLGNLGSYAGSPFLSQDADDFLDSPENDDIDEDFFVDSITEASYKSDEENVG